MKRLKRNQLFFGTLLMMTFLLGTAVPALAGQTPGVLDCVEGDSVRGWAWNSSDPASAVEVKVTVTNQATGQTEAEYTAPPPMTTGKTWSGKAPEPAITDLK